MKTVPPRFVSIALVLASLFCLPFVLDLSHAPRLTLLALLCFVAFLLPVIQKKTIFVCADLPVLLYGVFALWVTLSVSWSLNSAEAIFSASKVIVGFSVFVLARYFLQQDPVKTLKVIYEAAIVLAVLLIILVTSDLLQIKNFSKDEMYKVTALHGHKNLLSSFLLLILAILVPALIDSTAKRKTLILCLVVVLAGLILVLRTKAVWLGILFALFAALLLIILRNKKIRVSLFAVTLIIIVSAVLFWLLIYPVLVDIGLRQINESGLTGPMADKERLQLWSKTIDMVWKNPLTGAGAGNWQINFPDMTLTNIWRAEDLNYTFQRPHNDFLWILSEAGVLGFILYISFLAVVLATATKGVFNHPESSNTKTIAGIVAVVGFLTASAFDFPRERAEHILWFNLLLAVVCHFSNQAKVPQVTFRINTLVLACCVTLLSFIVIAGLLRIKGEYYTRELYNNRKAAAHFMITDNARRAKSFVYNMDPTSVPLTWYSGNALAELTQIEEACRHFEQAYKTNPYNRNVLNDLGSAYVRIGRQNEAKVLYREAARISPRFDEAKLNLVAVLISEHHYKEAQQWLNSLYHDSERRTKYEMIVQKVLNENLHNSSTTQP